MASESRTSARRLEGAARVNEAVRLRKQRLPYRVIAERCGYADESGARKAVEEALRATREATSESAEELREIEVAALDRLERRLTRTALDTETDAAKQAMLAGAIVRVQERRSKLLGLDSPTRVGVEHSGRMGPPTWDPSRYSDDELAQLVEIERRAEERARALPAPAPKESP